MVSLDSRTLDSLFQRGRWLTFPDFVRIVEGGHPHDEPGLPRAVLDAYAQALVDDLGGAAPFTVEALERRIQRHLTDDGWSRLTVHEVGDDRISYYPPAWHDKLTDETDPREYVAVMQEDVDPTAADASSRFHPRVPKEHLLNAMVVLGGMSRQGATERIDDLRKRGELLVYPFQNPEADVLLP
ncbi:hypothetical protein [Haloarchaeobius amylolyticus]|uniref:hypothetical protein n=1 Tax=Haloarchaeobius amylolyticus TaxID=1198296 RepID=UPI002270E868|nr:hypothetical protein [Haloarchaeobius amylolyticus]